MASEQAEWLKIGVDGVVPIEWAVSKSNTGEVSGWASVYNVVDLQDDVVVPGAFKRTINAWKASGRGIPLALDHEHSTDAIIGAITALTETPTGLKFTAKFSGKPKAQEARMMAKEGTLKGLSIYGPIFTKSFETRDQREIRVLQEVGLIEISLTGFPANDRTQVTAVKNDGPELDEAWLNDMRAALTISSPMVRKAAVEELIKAIYGDLPKLGEQQTGDGTGTGDGDKTEDAAKYALDLIGETGPSDADDHSPGGDSEYPLADQIMASIEVETHRKDLAALLAEIESEV